MRAGGETLDRQPEGDNKSFGIGRIVAVEVAILPATRRRLVGTLIEIDREGGGTHGGGRDSGLRERDYEQPQHHRDGGDSDHSRVQLTFRPNDTRMWVRLSHS